MNETVEYFLLVFLGVLFSISSAFASLIFCQRIKQSQSFVLRSRLEEREELQHLVASCA
jgi:hypothetical protein